jgi:RNase H-fold protein (predicted Holliday junction resolvase)
MTNHNQESQRVIGFDPGRDKCGIARVQWPCRSPVSGGTGQAFRPDIAIDQMEVVESASAIAAVVAQCQIHPITTIVIGDGTSSKHWRQQLAAALPETVTLVAVNEYNSTQEARDRYWRIHPARGLSGLLPPKLRSIPGPIDDIVAVILVERWITTQSREF